MQGLKQELVLFFCVRFVPFGPGEHEEFLRGLGFSGATLARKLGRSGSGSGSSSGSGSGFGSSSGSGSGSSSRVVSATGSGSSQSDPVFDAFTPPPQDPVFDAFTPPSPSPTGQDELDARPPSNQQPTVSPAPRRLAPSGEGFSLPSPFGGTAETVGGIANIADTALGLGLPGLGPAANLAVQAGQFLNLPESQRGSIDKGEAVSSLLPFGLGGDNIETQFAKLTSQDELNAGESIPNIPTGQDELDAGITDDFSDFKNFQGFEGRSDGLTSFGFQDFEGGLPFDPNTAAPGSREEAFLQTINPDFRASGSGDPVFDAFDPPAPDTTFDAFNPSSASPFEIVPPPGTDPRFDPFDNLELASSPDTTFEVFDAFNPDLGDDPVFDAFNPNTFNIPEQLRLAPPLPLANDPVFDAFDPPAPDTTFDAFDPPTPALSRNPEEAERQVKAANITQAVEAQNPGSLGKERVRSASQVLRESFDRNTREREAGNRGLETGVQVAGLGDIVDFFTPENRLDQARRRAEESAARRRQGVLPAGLQRAQRAAAITNPASGGVFGPTVPNVQVGGAGRQGTLVPSPQEVIRALAAPDGKGGIAPQANRSILDRIRNISLGQGVPSATTQLPAEFNQEAANARFIAQQEALDRQAAGQGGGASNTGNTGQLPAGNQGTGRGVIKEIFKLLGIGGAAGGLVGLMRKGN